MGCFTFSAERQGQIVIGASMICTIAHDDRRYLKDSLGNYLRDSEGAFLAVTIITT